MLGRHEARGDEYMTYETLEKDFIRDHGNVMRLSDEQYDQAFTQYLADRLIKQSEQMEYINAEIADELLIEGSKDTKK